ncbi:dihydrofolate reductase family protein [Paraliobacillus salinarum]|uniref:dihydrofolate reductase family protein n=1 Tax=Paraliobacillus salinarum TaxID=1158996 RepID=UPI0015F75444|nr:dihydrofolate reductase family protein [Paraliobacillus salinarum]
MKRKIILNLAISLDGYIADMDGNYEWIKGDSQTKLDTEKDFSFPEFMNQVDTIIMGRKSFEDCPMEAFANHKIIVATSQDKKNEVNIEFINTDIVAFVQDLQNREGKDIWLFGGSALTADFIQANVIDEYIIGIVPIILGDGIRLFKGNNPTIPLQLEDYTVKEGLPIFTYTRR